MAIAIVHFDVEMAGVDRQPSFVPDETDVVMVVTKKRVECVVRKRISNFDLFSHKKKLFSFCRLPCSSLQ